MVLPIKTKGKLTKGYGVQNRIMAPGRNHQLVFDFAVGMHTTSALMLSRQGNNSC